MADIGAYLIWIVLFGLLFILPIRFMIKHNKKSKIKVAELKREQGKETPVEAKQREQEHNQHIGTVIGIAAGVLIGSKLLGSVLIGLVLAIVLGTLGRFLTSKKD